jgi:hypothetical protein
MTTEPPPAAETLLVFHPRVDGKPFSLAPGGYCWRYEPVPPDVPPRLRDKMIGARLIMEIFKSDWKPADEAELERRAEIVAAKEEERRAEAQCQERAKREREEAEARATIKAMTMLTSGELRREIENAEQRITAAQTLLQERESRRGAEA